MKRVIITGATGFVGSNLARRLLCDGHEVHLLLRPNYQPWRINEIKADVRCHILHLHDSEAVTLTAAQIRPDWVFHLAAYGAYSWQNDLPQMIQTNIVGTVNLVTACLRTGFEAFVNTGSSSEYGIKDQPPSETEFLEPNSHYAVTKSTATLFCRHTALQEKANLSTLRLYSVYGPHEAPNRLIPRLIVLGLQGRLPPLVDPNTVRDFVYVDDVVDAYLSAATHSGQELGSVYNVGTGIQTSMGHIVDIARSTMKITMTPVWGSMPARKWDTTCWVADNRSISRALNWQPRYNLDDGFRRTLMWFRANPAMLSFYSSSDKL